MSELRDEWQANFPPLTDEQMKSAGLSPLTAVGGLDGSDGLDGSHGDRVEASMRTVLDEVRAHMAAYLMPASEEDLDVLTLWAVGAHLVQETYTTPRLIITSPVPGP